MDVMGTGDKKAGKMVREWLINYMTAPVVAMVVEEFMRLIW